MSASEKLKALLDTANAAERGWDNDLHGEPLLVALPQIVAVVEAAERPSSHWHESAAGGYDEDIGGFRCNICAALSALEEALS